MRLLEINSTDDINTLLPILEKECSISIAAYKATKRILYRGLNRNKVSDYHTFPKILKDKSPEHRKSISIHYTQEMFEFINDCLRILNFSARRDNSISCSTSYNRARMYTSGSSLISMIIKGRGPVYGIFPTNGFSFLWSAYGDFGAANLKFEIIKNPYEITKEQANTVIEECNFRKDNFIEALKSNREISIHGEYYAIDISLLDKVRSYFNIR